MGLLKVNAAKENNDVYVSIFFFYGGKRLNTLLVMSLCAKMIS